MDVSQLEVPKQEYPVTPIACSADSTPSNTLSNQPLFSCFFIQYDSRTHKERDHLAHRANALRLMVPSWEVKPRTQSQNSQPAT